MRRPALIFTVTTASALTLAACGSSSDPMASGSSTSSASAATSAATGADSSSGGATSSAQSIAVGSADFSESQLLAEIYAGALQAKGINATAKLNIGSREVSVKALQDGSIDVMPEYTGAMAFYYDKNFTETDPQAVYDALKGMLPADLTLLQASAAEDNDSINVTKATAQKYQLTSVADLAAHAGDLTLGAPPEFKLRPQGIPGLEKTYGVTFGTFRPLKGAALVNALKNGQVDAANIFSTDPAIAANDFVTLTDDKRLFGAQNIVPLVRADAATPEVSAALDAVNAKLTTATLSDLLKKTDIDKQDPATVAKEFLTANGLG